MTTFEQFVQGSPQTKQKKIGNYLIEKTLGKGTFGKVKLATHIPTGQKVAIKILEKDKIVDVADVQRVSRQMHILKLIRHPNIIQLYQIIQSPKHLFLVMEYMENGELFDYIVRKERMDEEEACKVFEQIISGIQYIHRLRIVHRDLKLENLLMDYDKTIRIVDFGLSNTYKVDERLRTACGSPCYAAPQMIQSKHPYEPIMVDVWSAGVILYAMVCGSLPFEDKDTAKLYKKILAGEYLLPQYISSDLRSFLKKILTVDPTQRIRIEDMKKDKWWRKYSDNYYPEGLIVGYHKIPIDQAVLKELASLEYDVDKTEKSLQANRHNNETTTYYLILKKFLRMGGISKADFGGAHFDKHIIEPNQRRQKNTLKPSDLIKMVTSPVIDKRAKSYYLGAKHKHEEEKSFGNNSVRIQQRRKSQSKSKSKQKRDKSMFKDTTINEAKQYHQPRPKSNKKSLNKSVSKSKKSPHKKDISLAEQDYLSRPRALSQKAKLNNKKSHQGSYMIGADSGADWPLEPKWKAGDAGGKIKNALRRR